MDRLWKYLMQMDARALFFASLALFLAVAGIVGWLYLHASSAHVPAQVPSGPTAPPPVERHIGVLGFVSNQLSPDALVVPVNPFRPSIEYMLTPTGMVFAVSTNRLPRRGTNLWARVRPPRDAAPVIPMLTFRGYFQRPDGTSAALFHDSVDDSSKFFSISNDLRGASLIGVNIRSAKVRKPDGQTVDLAIGESFTLPAIKP